MGRLLRFSLGLLGYMFACGAVTWLFMPFPASEVANLVILFALMSIGGILFLYEHEKKAKRPPA